MHNNISGGIRDKHFYLSSNVHIDIETNNSKNQPAIEHAGNMTMMVLFWFNTGYQHQHLGCFTPMSVNLTPSELTPESIVEMLH